MNYPPELLVLVGTLGASALAVVATLAATWITKRSEERKHLRELVMQAAIENWKRQMEIYKETKRAMRLVPLDVYIIQMLKLSDVLMSKDLTPENVIDRLRETDQLTDAVSDYKREYTDERLRKFREDS
jgi:hypothetical protein